MKKLVIIGLVLAAVAGMWWLGQDSEETGGSGTLSNHIYGKADSTVELTEYGDFQCPSCAQFYPLVKELKETYKDSLKFQFRHFPIRTIHPNAQAAHRAAEAAGKQGKFWEMHDLLYEGQQTWTNGTNVASTFEQYASQLQLNMEQFKTDVASAETNSTINADIASGQDKGVSGTPSFFLNGNQIELRDIDSLEKFSKLISDELAKQNQSSETPAPTTTE